jgi:hypothetical protein
MGGGGVFAYFKFIRISPRPKATTIWDDYDYGEMMRDLEDEDDPGRPRKPMSRTLTGAAMRKVRDKLE